MLWEILHRRKDNDMQEPVADPAPPTCHEILSGKAPEPRIGLDKCSLVIRSGEMADFKGGVTHIH